MINFGHVNADWDADLYSGIFYAQKINSNRYTQGLFQTFIGCVYLPQSSALIFFKKYFH